MWKPYSIYLLRKLDDNDVQSWGWGWDKPQTDADINLDPDEGTTLDSPQQDTDLTSLDLNTAGTVQSSSQEAANNPSQFNGQYTNLMASRNKAQRKALRHMNFTYIDANTGERMRWTAGGNKWKFNRLIKRQRNAINEKNLQSAEGQKVTEGWNPVLALIYNEMNSNYANDNYVTFTAGTQLQLQEQVKATPLYRYNTGLSDVWNGRNLAAIAGLNDDQKKLLADDSGNITDASIKAFQTSKQIAADAMIGNNTLRALGVNIPGITPQGRVVRPVNWDARNQTEYDKLDLTLQALLGGYNMAAVKTFQNNHGLRADGIIGRLTLAKIYELMPSGDADLGSSGQGVDATDTKHGAYILNPGSYYWEQWAESNGFGDAPETLTDYDVAYIGMLYNNAFNNVGDMLDWLRRLSPEGLAYVNKKFKARKPDKRSEAYIPTYR